MAYLFDPPPQPALPVFGTDLLFPVRRIWCVGRNYAEHAREMGHDPDREPPFFFAKPADAIVASGSTIPFPMATEDLHHEIELVVAIGQGGVAIDAERALDHVFGYAVGLDMTRRDRQAEAKRLARPWEMGKAFDRSAPMSAIAPASRIGHPVRGAIVLAVNGEIRQAGDLAQQIWSVAETIAHLSRLVELAPGDLIMTGTPAGVGPVRPGDRLEGRIEAVGELAVTYAAT
ncbi:fumarylacetoacetate hydrolase family protein [Elioraea thermophila]|uniref:fumarylacetoacetate hydrolase family protein n=1 Tax=Elioraea thermophila TaxID=2185104 RepID=UPI000DF2609A|nr:fumarylacetoacetate hydrolase family protein [Elioraea thermophila]